MSSGLLARSFRIFGRLKVSDIIHRSMSATMASATTTEPQIKTPEPQIKAELSDVPAEVSVASEAAVDLSKSTEVAGDKRSNNGQAAEGDGPGEAKRAKTEHNEGDEPWSGYSRPFYKKKKVALMMVYSGKGYNGMQMNPGMKTIEQDLLDALLKAGVVTEDHITKPGVKMGFQRAARTDKGVSAAGQVVSLKMFVDVENAVEKINSHLVDQIRVIGFKRVTRGFSSKDTCSSRTYIYMLPTFTFTPVEETVTHTFRITDEIREQVNKVLGLYKGTHNFHNFTSGKKPNDPSAHRYIMEMEIGEPFIKDDVEYAVIRIKGQSFMLHQIRKMIGLMIAIVRGLASVKSMEYAFRPEKADVPVAPSLGLMLDQLHYDAYNKRFGSDGQHEPIEWDEFEETIEAFKNQHIFSTMIETERKERSMMKWLATLHNHHFEPKKSDDSIRTETKHGQAANNVRELRLGLPGDSDTAGQATSEQSTEAGTTAEASPDTTSPSESSRGESGETSREAAAATGEDGEAASVTTSSKEPSEETPVVDPAHSEVSEAKDTSATPMEAADSTSTTPTSSDTSNVKPSE